MTGFLFLPKIRNKSLYILRNYVFLTFYFLCLTASVYGTEVSSNYFLLDIPFFSNGFDSLSSANNNMEWGIAGGFLSIEELSSPLFRLLSGPLYLMLPPLPWKRIRVISNLRAKTEVFGEPILEGVWQKDNDPYFYWDIEMVPSQLIKGFSISLDVFPDATVDTVSNYYQFPEDSITSGKRTFFVLPIMVGDVPDFDSLLEFQLWVDVEPPIINQLNPPSGTLTSNNYIPITCFLSDSHSGLDLDRTTLILNNHPVYFNYDSQRQILEFKPDTALVEGKNTVLLKAYDKANNYATKGWEFIVDTQPPWGSILINNGQEITHSSYVFINIKVEDAVSGIKSIYISNDGVFDTELNHPYPYAPVIYNWLVSEPDINGLKTVYVKFEDFAGNLSEVYQDTIILELRTPDTRIISGPPTVTKDKEAKFLFEASREGCQFSYKLDNLEWSEWQILNEANFNNLSEGNHYFYVKSGFDLNGDGKITIDETDPTPAQWVWTIKPEGFLEKVRQRILFWRR
jgi:hypothetical protein